MPEGYASKTASMVAPDRSPLDNALNSLSMEISEQTGIIGELESRLVGIMNQPRVKQENTTPDKALNCSPVVQTVLVSMSAAHSNTERLKEILQRLEM